MQVKTYKASTMEKALALVKKELGPDAIILSSRKAPGGTGEYGFEVTAARDQQAEASTTGAVAPVECASAEMQNDIQEIKSFLSLLISSKDHFAQHQMKQPVAQLYHSLLVRGFDEKQIYLLLNKAASDLNGNPADARLIFEAFSKRVLAKVGLAKPFRTISNTSSGAVFTFLGPTGVGKTTTLAKVAAYLKIKRQLEVGVVSLDTYRIGAVDQLQTYANILEVPFIVAQSKAELAGSLEEYRHCDVILVDTTGRNFLQREHVQRLQSLFEDDHKFNHFLVLSATAKDEDLKQTIIHFREMDINSLIFTKLDETVHHGCMLNQLLRFDYPLSYMGTGQRVPEDIEPATQKRILSFLLPVRNQTA
ncbi:MAG: AAA family ATPase [Syntrophobacteraceae bacterium]